MPLPPTHIHYLSDSLSPLLFHSHSLPPLPTHIITLFPFHTPSNSHTRTLPNTLPILFSLSLPPTPRHQGSCWTEQWQSRSDGHTRFNGSRETEQWSVYYQLSSRRSCGIQLNGWDGRGGCPSVRVMGGDGMILAACPSVRILSNSYYLC